MGGKFSVSMAEGFEELFLAHFRVDPILERVERKQKNSFQQKKFNWFLFFLYFLFISNRHRSNSDQNVGSLKRLFVDYEASG